MDFAHCWRLYSYLEKSLYLKVILIDSFLLQVYSLYMWPACTDEEEEETTHGYGHGFNTWVLFGHYSFSYNFVYIS